MGSTYQVAKGKSCVNKDEPLTRLAITAECEGEFAVIFSMSHTIADGATYYSVLNMLGSKGEVTSLNASRKNAEADKIAETVGKAQHSYQYSMGYALPLMCGMCF